MDSNGFHDAGMFQPDDHVSNEAETKVELRRLQLTMRGASESTLGGRWEIEILKSGCAFLFGLPLFQVSVGMASRVL